MKGLEQTQNNSEANTTLEKLNAIYLAVYTLISKGSKKEEFQMELNKNLVPKKSISTLRSYCSSLTRIPDERKKFFIPYICDMANRNLRQKMAGMRIEFEKMMTDMENLHNDLNQQLTQFKNENKEEKDIAVSTANKAS